MLYGAIYRGFDVSVNHFCILTLEFPHFYFGISIVSAEKPKSMGISVAICSKKIKTVRGQSAFRTPLLLSG